jgi:hypothetical protein
MNSSTVRLTIGGVAALAFAACASDPAPSVTSAGPTSPCLLEQRPLVQADGSELYIEPQTLFQVGSEWLVAGSPSYGWSVAPGRDAVQTSRLEHVAAFLGHTARAIERPLPGPIGSMISTPLGDGRWAAIFDEVMSADSVPAANFPISYWYGEHDGSRWTLVEPLPTPPGSEISLRQSSALVNAGDRLVWISFENVRIGMELHRYERRDGAWRYERLPGEWLERVEIGYALESGLWMALVGPDADLPRFRKSIRLYREGPPLELVSRIDTLPGGPTVPELAVDVLPDGVTVSWIVGRPGGWGAFARTDIRPGNAGTLLALDDNARHLYSIERPDGTIAWLAEHEDRETRYKELRLLRLDGSRIVRAASAPSPFTGFFATAPHGADEVLLVGPQMGLAPPETPVRSLILRLSTSC